MSYRPGYVWPNEAFPFRVYFENPDCRIFIIENVPHNWEWLSTYHAQFRETDVFLVYCGWHLDAFLAKETRRVFDVLGLKDENFVFMFNSLAELETGAQQGLSGDVINHNAWLDDRLIVCLGGEVEKRFDAIYVARQSAFKRHDLAQKIPNLALITGLNHGDTGAGELPPHVYRNETPLIADEVCLKMNEARCGLILSKKEGACFASSEYLLSGIPVVSTKSFGGRDIWYDDYNSIVCEPDADAIASAVRHFVENPPDPMRIRNTHIELAKTHRKTFVATLGKIFDRFGIEIDPQTYFDANYIHKMRSAYAPDFERIFG